jgi:hypothetical protein
MPAGACGCRNANSLAKLVKDIVVCILRTGNTGPIAALTDSRGGCLKLGEQRVDCLNRWDKFQKRRIEAEAQRSTARSTVDRASTLLGFDRRHATCQAARATDNWCAGL